MFSKILGEVKGIFNITTIIDLIVSLLFVVIGIIFFSNQSTNISLVTIIISLLLIGNGISSIFAYIKKGTIVLYNNNLIYGIVLILIGVLSICLSSIFKILLAIYLLVVGIQRINYGIFFKKFNESSWILTLVLGILFMIIGIIVFFTNKDNIVNVSSVCTFGFGLMNGVNLILLRKRSMYFIA